MSSGKSIVKNLSDKGRMTDSLTEPRSSAISESSFLTGTPEHIKEWLMSSQGGFHASRFRSQESKPEKTTPAICGLKPLKPFASYNHDTHSWKMSKGLPTPKDSLSKLLKRFGSSVFLAKGISSRTQGISYVTSSRLPDYLTSGAFLGTWPKAGMMQNGVCLELTMSGLRMKGKGSGLWPTVQVSEARQGLQIRREGKGGNQESLTTAVRMWPTPRAGKTTSEKEEAWMKRHDAGKVATPPLGLAVRMWPTPTSTERSGTNPKTGKGEGLSKTVKNWPTVQTRDYRSADKVGSKNLNRKIKKGWTVDLNTAVKQYPTPSSSMVSMADMEQARFSGNSPDRPKYCDAAEGQLNPDWVCWLQGWIIGWDSLEPITEMVWLDWTVDPADIGEIPRIASGIKGRVDRLKALGNGQVPLCAATAWKILAQ